MMLMVWIKEMESMAILYPSLLLCSLRPPAFVCLCRWQKPWQLSPVEMTEHIRCLPSNEHHSVVNHDITDDRGPSPLPSLPSGWTFVGETFGTNNTLEAEIMMAHLVLTMMTRYDGKVSINIRGNGIVRRWGWFWNSTVAGADPKSYSVQYFRF